MDTVATLLKARGYRTGAFVSAFPLDVRFGLARGFDVYDDRYGKAADKTAFHMPERPGADRTDSRSVAFEEDESLRRHKLTAMSAPSFVMRARPQVAAKRVEQS